MLGNHRLIRVMRILSLDFSKGCTDPISSFLKIGYKIVQVVDSCLGVLDGLAISGEDFRQPYKKCCIHGRALVPLNKRFWSSRLFFKLYFGKVCRISRRQSEVLIRKLSPWLEEYSSEL